MLTPPSRVLAVLVGGVVLLAAVAGIVVANRTPQALEEGSPEAVVREFLQAVLDGDYPQAASLLSEQSGCDLRDVADAPVPGSARIVLGDAVVDDDEAVVTVEVTESDEGDLWGGSEYSHSERVTVRRDGGAWMILASPWLLYSCDSTKG